MIFIGQGNETAEFGLFRRASVARRGGSKEAALARLFIVSNRVGSSLKANEGGLATAIHAATEERDIVWFGPSGDQVAGSGRKGG